MCSRPEAFEKQEPAESEELQTAAAVEQEKNGEEQEEEEEEEKAPLTGAAPTMKANGFTMLDTSFADMHLNRNRRKGVFDEDEDDEEDSD